MPPGGTCFHLCTLYGLLLQIVLLAVPVKAQSTAASLESPYSEAQIKAAFLFNFLKFIEWPTPATPRPDMAEGAAGEREVTPLRIALLGLSSGFEAELQNLQDQQVRSQPLEIQVLDTWPSAESLSGFHVLILNPQQEEDFTRLRALDTPPGLLLIGENMNVADQGGMIDFYRQQDRVRFRINRRNLEAATLKISSKLLRLATQVTDRPSATPRKEETP